MHRSFSVQDALYRALIAHSVIVKKGSKKVVIVFMV